MAPAPQTGRSPRVSATAKRVVGLGLLLIALGALASSDWFHQIVLRLVEPAEYTLSLHDALPI